MTSRAGLSGLFATLWLLGSLLACAGPAAVTHPVASTPAAPAGATASPIPSPAAVVATATPAVASSSPATPMPAARDTGSSSTEPATAMTGRATASVTARPAPPPTAAAARTTVFLIVLENQDWSGIRGNTAAPYLNQTLVLLASRDEQYFTPPGNHPSLPNYLWLEAGTNFGVTDDGPPAQHTQGSDRHFTALLRAAGIPWKAYEEGVDGTTCPLQDEGRYATKHDPFVYFDDVTDGGRADSAYCTAHVRPFAELAGDLAAGRVGRYNFITPDLCHDMHNACPPENDRVAQGDRWLAAEVPTILNSAAYRAGGALFITWDEGLGDSDGPIGLLLLSPLAKGHGYASSARASHSATLRTIQELLGVGPLLGSAASSPDLADLFAAPLSAVR